MYCIVLFMWTIDLSSRKFTCPLLTGTSCIRLNGTQVDTTVGYLLGEELQADLFKDTAMLKRFQDIAALPDKEKECLLLTVDHFIKATKFSML